ncbi:hypothetical protein CXB51_034414 [Gossypium anomalum]|uniref:Uncharacterized protein n=1 Tax=Gossypium anomalum TaxID=47600 RepID=A0A8J5Y8H6_9ROSI|nr:hypothetical protein CXB51_034414 [Gossypium anomalum]
MNGAKRSTEAMGCKNASVRKCSALGESTRMSKSRQSGSKNVGLSTANIGENPMLRKPKGSSIRSIHEGVTRVEKMPRANVRVPGTTTLK